MRYPERGVLLALLGEPASVRQIGEHRIGRSFSRKVRIVLTIKDPKTARLAQELAKVTKESIANAVAVALQERLDRVRAAEDPMRLAAELLKIGHHCAKHATLDPRSPDEILGYDENGLL